MSNSIEHVIPDNIKALIGHNKDAGQCSFAILQVIGTGMTEHYPSVRPDGKEGHYDESDYWRHKVTRERLTVRVVVSGNAVSAEDYIQSATVHKAMAINPNTVDIYVDNLQPKREAA